MPTQEFQTIQRQWSMLRAIPSRPQTITAPLLLAILRSEGFQSSIRTIERDLHELSIRFPLTVDDSVKPYRWSWMPNATLDFLPGLSVSQCLALSIAQAHMRHLLPKAIFDDLAPLFEAANRELAKSGWKDWHKRIAVAPSAFALLPPKIDFQVLTDVQHAIAHRLRLTANYRSKGNKAPKQRTIDPLGLLIRGSVQYLVCMLPEHDEPCQLAIHRMTDTVIGTHVCKDPYGFSMRRYAANLAIASRGKIRLRIVVDALAAEHLRETPLSKYQTWRPIEGTGSEGTGKVEISATVDNDVQLKRWLLSFGSELEVTGPEHLRLEMVAELRKAARAYTK